MKKLKSDLTNFLFSTPDFWGGAGTAINLAGNFYAFNFSESDFEADETALANDFMMIGRDIQEAVQTFSENPHNLIAAQ